MLDDALTRCRSHLSADGAARCARLFEDDLLPQLAAALAAGHAGALIDRPPPRLPAELTPPRQDAFAPFAEAVGALVETPDDPALHARLAACIEAADHATLLRLLGLRQTPASLLDARGYPPRRATLLASAAEALADGLTVAARALTKHAPRSAESFWGTPTGTIADKNRQARALLESILAAPTWWNVFGHHQHETVYEARLPAGHGARWGAGGTRFVGFLDPFEADAREN